MNQCKCADTQSSVTDSVTEPVPLDEDWDAVRERIRAGRAFLRVIEYPWGVEFEVCDLGLDNELGGDGSGC